MLPLTDDLLALGGCRPIEDHETLCPGALELAEKYYEEWEPAKLKFNPDVSPLKPNDAA